MMGVNSMLIDAGVEALKEHHKKQLKAYKVGLPWDQIEFKFTIPELTRLLERGLELVHLPMNEFEMNEFEHLMLNVIEDKQFLLDYFECVGKYFVTAFEMYYDNFEIVTGSRDYDGFSLIPSRFWVDVRLESINFDIKKIKQRVTMGPRTHRIH